MFIVGKSVFSEMLSKFNIKTIAPLCIIQMPSKMQTRLHFIRHKCDLSVQMFGIQPLQYRLGVDNHPMNLEYLSVFWNENMTHKQKTFCFNPSSAVSVNYPTVKTQRIARLQTWCTVSVMK